MVSVVRRQQFKIFAVEIYAVKMLEIRIAPALATAGVDAADVQEAFATWRSECEHARRNAAAADSLDVTGQRRGEAVTLGWILVHMIEEYARHNGHADFLRERIDGAVGD